MTLTIKVAEVRWPSEGKKTGLVKDQTGKMWGAFPEVLNQLQQGGTYDIVYTSRNWNNKTYYTISQAIRSSDLNLAPLRVVQTGPQGQVSGGDVPQQRPLTSQPDNERRLDIFVCGAFNNLMANTNVNPHEMSMLDMIDTLHKLKSAWNGVFGPSPLPRPATPPRQTVQQSPNPIVHGPDDDMEDSIPF